MTSTTLSLIADAVDFWVPILGALTTSLLVGFPIIWAYLPSFFGSRFDETLSPLAAAVELGSLLHVRLYLFLGADPNGKVPSGRTSIIWGSALGERRVLDLAIEGRSTEILSALVRGGAYSYQTR